VNGEELKIVDLFKIIIHLKQGIAVEYVAGYRLHVRTF
jgi:hypothetical protein